MIFKCLKEHNFALLYLIFAVFSFQKCANKEKTNMPNSIPVIEGRINFIGTIATPDTISSPMKYYFGLQAIACGPNDTLFCFEMNDCQIIAFSVISTKELFRFGKKGQGPGEFSSRVPFIFFSPHHGLIAIDNNFRRFTIFTSKGEVIKTFNLPLLTDNLIILNDSLLIMSNLLLRENWKPLRLFNYKTHKILCEFGKIEEPKKGLFKAIANSPFRASDEKMFSYNLAITRILYLDSEMKVVLGQKNPYRLSTWSICENDGKFFQAKVPYSTERGYKYEIKGDTRVGTILPTARAFGPFLIKYLLVACIFNPECNENYLDTYSLDGNFLNRYRIPSLPKGVWVKSVDFDGENRMYLLVNEKEKDIDWIEVYKCEIKS